MRMVTNKRNQVVLKDFEAKIIVPVFGVLHDMVTSQCSDPESTRTFQQGSRELKEILTRVMSLGPRGGKFRDFCLSVQSQTTANEVLNIYEIYQMQVLAVSVYHNYSLSEVHTPPWVQKMFTEFYYDEAFADPVLWEMVCGTAFSKTAFQMNFRLDNNHLCVCPYCDIDTVISVSSPQIDHFLPKSKFPLISMCAANLIPACVACNKPQQGKGTSVRVPIVSPYNTQIGDDLAFTFDYPSLSIRIDSVSGSTQTRNYIELLQLKSRYAPSDVMRNVRRRAEPVLQTLKASKTSSRDMVRAYLSDTIFDNPLYFAIRSYVLFQ